MNKEIFLQNRGEAGLFAVQQFQNPSIPIHNSRKIPETIERSSGFVDLVSIVCPNWQVNPEGRIVAQISEETERANIFFGHDIPNLIEQLDL
ncbi:hypothetical protein ACFL1M_01650, partial [Patescibacteria group bacterium]